MNIVWGFAGTPATSPILSDSSADTHWHIRRSELALASASNGGVILGTARDDGAELVLLGTLHLPLEGWEGDSPVDAPDQAARYLLERFRRCGERFLDGVVGQFAVAVAERSRPRLWLAADPTGHRTFYVHRSGGAVAFSSHIERLAHLLGPRLEVDRSLEDFFLLHGFYPWGRTPFRNVVSLPKGTLVCFDGGTVTERAIALENPWRGRYDGAGLQGADEARAVEVLYDGFMAALSEQAAKSDRVGVLLGGFDSALVAAGLARLGKKVETFSFHYEEPRYNQPFTDMLARSLGIEHHPVRLTQERLKCGLDTFAHFFNQPTNWPNYVIQTLDCCEAMRSRGIRVVYSGDGCDSVFLGYPGTYRRAMVFERIPTLSAKARDALVGVVDVPLLERRLGHPYRIFLNMVRAMGRPMPQRGFLSFRIFDEVSLEALRRGDAPAQEKSAEDVARELAQPFTGLPMLRLAYLGKSAVSPNRNKMVGSSDATGLAILSPYMHPGMKQLSLSLPESLCRPSESTPSKVTGKYILMRMAEVKGLLPREIIFQPKMAAVDGPIDAWYEGPLAQSLKRLLDDLPFSPDPSYVEDLFRPKLAEKAFRRYLMTDKVISHAISLLITYSRFTALSPRGVAGDAGPPGARLTRASA